MCMVDHLSFRKLSNCTEFLNGALINNNKNRFSYIKQNQ